MKRSLTLAAAFALLAPLGAAHAETVVKEKHNGHVTVKHRPGHPNAVVVHPSMRPSMRPSLRPGARPSENRPHQFWHRGSWAVRIHGPAFRYPHGWARRHWAVGTVLPALFLTNEYYYDAYGALGLQAPPPGYRWVRYGDDLLLVNLRTGAVEDTVEDVFEN